MPSSIFDDEIFFFCCILWQKFSTKASSLEKGYLGELSKNPKYHQLKRFGIARIARPSFSKKLTNFSSFFVVE